MGVDEADIQSERRPSPGSSRTGRRILHSFSIPHHSSSALLLSTMLAGIPDSRRSPAAFQSVLRAGPVYLLRATHQHVLLNALEDLLPLSCCFAGPTVLAFVPLPEAAEHLVEWVNDFQAETEHCCSCRSRGKEAFGRQQALEGAGIPLTLWLTHSKPSACLHSGGHLTTQPSSICWVHKDSSWEVTLFSDRSGLTAHSWI